MALVTDFDSLKAAVAHDISKLESQQRFIINDQESFASGFGGNRTHASLTSLNP